MHEIGFLIDILEKYIVIFLNVLFCKNFCPTIQAERIFDPTIQAERIFAPTIQAERIFAPLFLKVDIYIVSIQYVWK